MSLLRKIATATETGWASLSSGTEGLLKRVDGGVQGSATSSSKTEIGSAGSNSSLIPQQTRAEDSSLPGWTTQLEQPLRPTSPASPTVVCHETPRPPHPLRMALLHPGWTRTRLPLQPADSRMIPWSPQHPLPPLQQPKTLLLHTTSILYKLGKQR